MALFESYERRIAQINKFLNDNGIASIEEAEQITKGKGLDIYKRVKDIQPICFENACWAYLVGAAVAIKRGQTVASEIAKTLGEGLQSFCIPGSVADDRKVGLGHGNLASMLLEEKTKGFTGVETEFDYMTGKLKIVSERAYSKGERAAVRCYGADDVREGVAIMWQEGVDIAITGNSTNPTRFQHPVMATYKKERIEKGMPFFSVASGGGTGRTLHPDNMAAGPASYGMTDTMGRMHSDAQFAGSSSVPAHVEMMGLIGMGNNPMVGASVDVAVAVAQAMK
mgnify:CR=1 FL=1